MTDDKRSSELLVRVTGISKRYRQIQALSDVSFSIRSGELLGLIGPNGAGKTTLFECVAGVQPADHGAVVCPRGETLRKSFLFYVPDGIAPWPDQPVEWALKFSLGFFGGRREIYESLVDDLRLAPLLRTTIAALSKGQRKRVLLAFGLLAPQPLVLIDEPFEGLDLRQSREAAAALRKHVSSGRTLFLSIHQIADAAQICDRFVLLSDGRVVAEGTFDELAALAENPSTAAILTLTVTVGTWIINFVADIKGGIWERIAGYTPTAMVAEFQHGLVRLDVVLIALTLVLAGLALAAIWMRLGVAVRRRVYESIALGAMAGAIIFACTFFTPSWDTSESRMNSFPKSDERALRQIHDPLRIEAHLAPEDPRRLDLERQAISKLRRIMPKLQVQYVSATSIGLFEQTSEHYGEIWYDLDGHRTMSRSTTAEGVIETIYSVAGTDPPPENDTDVFRGHPLAMPPKGAAIVFYGIWPAAVLAAGILPRRRRYT